MREERRNYLVVGVFVLAMLTGLLVWLAVLSGTLRATHGYTAVYDSVMGVSPGTQVLYEGHAIGRVEEVRPETRDGAIRFRVRLAIQRDWRIPEDAEAVIAKPGFLGSVVIDIRGGRSATALEPGSEIRAGAEPDVVAAVSSVASRLNDVVDERIAPLLDGVPEILDNLGEFSAELNRTGDQLGRVLDAENVRRVGSILANLEGASARLARFGGDLSATRERLDALLGRVEGLLQENRGTLDHAVGDLHESLEAFAVRSDAIAHDLEVTSRNLAEFSRRIRENPSLLVRGGPGPEEPD